MSGPLPCREGCRRDASYDCVHRFGPHVRAEILPPEKASASDLEVLKHFAHEIQKGIRGATICGTRWIIVTRDKGFWGSAKHMHESANRPGRCEMLFYSQDHRRVVLIVAGEHLLCIEIARISSKEGGIGKAGDFRRARAVVSKVLAQPKILCMPPTS